jgi:opacity protein-like surface antigen
MAFNEEADGVRFEKRIVMITTALCICASASAAWAGKPHERQGFFVGFGFGAGAATWEWTDPDFGNNPGEVSGTLNLRLGGALRDNLVLGVEFQGWAKRWSLLTSGGVEIGETVITLGSVTFASTWFPGNMGVYLRGGIGVSWARWEIKQTLFTAVPGTLEATDTGIGILGATGYEWRVTDKFTIGPQVEISWYAIDGDFIKDPFIIDVSIQFNWYW